MTVSHFLFISRGEKAEDIVRIDATAGGFVPFVGFLQGLINQLKASPGSDSIRCHCGVSGWRGMMNQLWSNNWQNPLLKISH
ncbi:Hypothetical protein NTJ_07777 [Nesidiocoris tenuis]|uniref:Uncharacterized protein n=1 Tax=Nesidiocoris tenuis TaxID=355587 RepID=A0ABN7AUB9_9HEMI|nr:Hypothetical protein NTJ_07777 [Nesidiocoris tenuis]